MNISRAHQTLLIFALCLTFAATSDAQAMTQAQVDKLVQNADKFPTLKVGEYYKTVAVKTPFHFENDEEDIHYECGGFNIEVKRARETDSLFWEFTTLKRDGLFWWNISAPQGVKKVKFGKFERKEYLTAQERIAVNFTQALEATKLESNKKYLIWFCFDADVIRPHDQGVLYNVLVDFGPIGFVGGVANPHDLAGALVNSKTEALNPPKKK
jgi:hypothetical protein